MIEEFASIVPKALRQKSGKVFYSGRQAFSAPCPLYVLGLNPGGNPLRHAQETIQTQIDAVLKSHAADWSAYRDESWEGAAPGTYGIAPRVLHLFNALGLNPGRVPCSNLVFVRSRSEHDLCDKNSLVELCWDFHEKVIAQLRPRVILCLGQTVGSHVRRNVHAHGAPYNEVSEKNNRKWRSQAFFNDAGLKVVVVTHPSRADWRVEAADPTQLVAEALK